MHRYHLALFLVPLAAALLSYAAARTMPHRLGVQRLLVGVTTVVMVVTAAITSRSLDYSGTFSDFGGALLPDKLGLLATGGAALLALAGVLAAIPLLPRLRPHAAELHTFVLASLAGAVLASMGQDLVAIAAGIELTWLPLVVAGALWKTGALAVRSTARQLVWSVAASALTLLGFALLAALSGTTRLLGMSFFLSPQAGRPVMAASGVAFVLLLAGLGARLGLPLFGGLADDHPVRQPAAVTGLLLSLGLLPVFTAFARVLLVAAPGVRGPGAGFLAVVTALTLLLGAAQALRSRTLRGLLSALVTVSGGVLLLGVLTPVQEVARAQQLPHATAAVVAALVVAGAWVGVCGVLGVMEAAAPGHAEPLVRVRPELGIPLVLGVMTLAGAPPLAGFFVRLLLLQEAQIAGFAWLVALAAVATLVTIVAAARVLAPLVFESPGEGERVGPPLGRPVLAALTAFGLLTVLLPVLGQPLLSLAAAAGAPGAH